MHIEFRMPNVNGTVNYNKNANATSQHIVTMCMQKWSLAYPNCPYTIAVAEGRVLLRFDNPSDTSIWLMTWEQHRGNFHASSWKRITVVDESETVDRQ